MRHDVTGHGQAHGSAVAPLRNPADASALALRQRRAGQAAQAWAALGAACLLQKRIDEAITHLRHGIRISPLDSRLSIWGALLAITLMLAKDIDGARQQGEWACQRDDRSYLPRVVLAAVNLVDNDRERALKALNDAYRIKPDLSSMQIEFLVGRTLGKSLLELKQSAPFSP